MLHQKCQRSASHRHDLQKMLLWSLFSTVLEETEEQIVTICHIWLVGELVTLILHSHLKTANCADLEHFNPF